MPDLTQDPASLGLHAPRLGPWFSDAALELPQADDRLFVEITAGGGSEFLPPASGLLSFAIASDPRPRRLAPLRDGAGAPAFDTGHLVAEFTLLPEVEERLDRLMRGAPSLESADPAGQGRTRARVRTFAIEIVNASPGNTHLLDLVPVLPPESEPDRVRHLGLVPGTPLQNGPRPMADLYQPGKLDTVGTFHPMLQFGSDTLIRLWTFDHRGRAIDPGAVATWWRWLVDEYTHPDHSDPPLWAEGLEAADRRTMPIRSGAEERVLQFCDLHGGPPGDALTRIDATNLTGTGAVRRQTDAAAVVTVELSDPPSGGAPDDLPVARVALLPDGRLDDTVSLWAPPGDPSATPFDRDFARIVVASMETTLTGQPRVYDGPTATDAQREAERRAEDQARETTRINVARAERTDALIDTNEGAITAVGEVFTGPDETDFATGVLDPAWGPITPSLPDVDPPGETPGLTVEALTGGGTASGDTVTDQRVLVTVEVDAALAGAWVRVWTQGFHRERAEHYKLDGGAGRVDAAGLARMVADLPDGSIAPDTPMGLDVIVVTQRGSRHFADLRFPRPAPVGGDAVALSTTSGDVLVCETGEVHATLPLPADAVPSGVSLVGLTPAPPVLVDAATVPLASRADAIGSLLAAGDRVRMVEPAFKASPEGASAADIPAATVRRTERTLPSAWQAGFPLPTMERLEIVASNVDATAGLAAVSAVPSLSPYHEFLDHRRGNPNAPAGPDTHGTGVRIVGPAAALVAEYTRDRTAEHTLDLVERANTPIPTPPDVTGTALWMAGLRTVAAGVECEVALGVIAGSTGYPLGGTWDEIEEWLNDNVGSMLGTTVAGTLGGTAAQVDSILRALDRRFLAARRGAQEGAVAMKAAIERAQDLIYIETPALDTLASGESGSIDLWDSLVTRMNENPALHVVVCTPVFLIDGSPARLQRVRDQLLMQVNAAVQATAATGAVAAIADRVAVFSPGAGPGRSLRIASTSMVVDDAWAITGTTHLWRRGLTFDSSYAVATTDERMVDGRPAAVADFRRTLIGGRLGIDPLNVPDDPAEVVYAVRELARRGGFGRLAVDRIRAPDPAELDSGTSETITDAELWNPDGTPTSGFDPVAWISGMLADVQDEELAGTS